MDECCTRENLSRDTHFWCNVWKAPTSIGQFPNLSRLLNLVDCAQTEVADLERASRIKEEVLGLEIPMTNTLFVDVSLYED